MKSRKKGGILFSILLWTFKSPLIRMLLSCFEHRGLLWPVTLKYNFKGSILNFPFSVTKTEIFGYTNDMGGSSKYNWTQPKLRWTAGLRFLHQLWKYQSSLQTLSTPTYSITLLTKVFKQQQLKRVNPDWEWDSIIKRHFQLVEIGIRDMSCQGKSLSPFNIT